MALTGSRSDGFPMAGLGRAPAAAVAESGRASRNFRDSEDVVDAADLGFPTFGERMWNATASMFKMVVAGPLRGRVC